MPAGHVEGAADLHSQAGGQPSTAQPPRQLQRRIGRGPAWAAVLLDACCIAAAVLAAYSTRASIGPPFLSRLAHRPEVYLRALPWIELVLLATAAHVGLYRIRLADIACQVPLVLRSTSIGVLLLAGASFLSHFDYSRAMLLMFWFYLTAFQLGARAALAAAVQRRLAREQPIRALIVGTGDLAELVADKLARAEAPGYECLGYVSCNGRRPGTIGHFKQLPCLCSDLAVEEVFVASPSLPTDELMAMVDQCRELPTRFYLVAGPFHVLMGAGALADLSRLPVIELPVVHQPSAAYLVAKRAMDVFASLLLLIVLAPLMLVLAMLIRRQSRGSALFVQQRVGQGGRVFNMYKFRTMYADVDPYAPAPSTPDDARVTPIGRWLRRYSLDELPQLINVLKGEMSLVGPRPEMPFIVERYKPWQRRRLEAKPGLTGLWQIMGRKDLPLAENIEYDFYYLRHQSLLLDIEILVRTIPAVLSGRGAY